MTPNHRESAEHLPHLDLDSPKTSRFLKLALGSEDSPIDELLERLSLPDGEDWLERVCREGPGRSLGILRWREESKASKDELLRLKDQAKDLFRSAGDQDLRLSGVLAYFLSLALGFVLLGVAITNRPREVIDPIFKDLACMLPPPWREIFARARER